MGKSLETLCEVLLISQKRLETDVVT